MNNKAPFYSPNKKKDRFDEVGLIRKISENVALNTSNSATIAFEDLCSNFEKEVREAILRFTELACKEIQKLKKRGEKKVTTSMVLEKIVNGAKSDYKPKREEMELVMRTTNFTEDVALKIILLRDEIRKLRNAGRQANDAVDELAKRMKRLIGEKKKHRRLEPTEKSDCANKRRKSIKEDNIPTESVKTSISKSKRGREEEKIQDENEKINKRLKFSDEPVEIVDDEQLYTTNITSPIYEKIVDEIFEDDEFIEDDYEYDVEETAPALLPQSIVTSVIGINVPTITSITTLQPEKLTSDHTMAIINNEVEKPFILEDVDINVEDESDNEEKIIAQTVKKKRKLASKFANNTLKRSRILNENDGS